MNKLSYERLKKVTETEKPYRGTTDRYPIWHRGHAHKCFFVKKDEQGNDEYHIAYGYNYGRKEITKEEHDLVMKIQEDNKIQRRLRKPIKRVPYVYTNGGYTMQGGTTEPVTYWQSIKDFDIVGVVRSDNTFEFTQEKYLGQGTRYFLTHMFGGTYWRAFTSQVRKGGVVYEEYSEGNTVKTIPIFKGQRLDLATNTSVINYTVHLPRVNRKRANQVLGGRKLEFKFMESVFKAMPSDVFINELQDTFKDVFGEAKDVWRGETEIDKLVKFAMECKDTDPVKSLYAIMISRGIANAWYLARQGQQWGAGPNPLSYFNLIKKHMVNQLIRDGGALDIKEVKPNEIYKGNSWGAMVTVDSKQVTVY